MADVARAAHVTTASGRRPGAAQRSRCLIDASLTPVAKTPAGTRVKLTVKFGETPPVPCVLITPSGRRYDVIGARGKTLHCIVGSPHSQPGPDDGPVLQWT